MSKHFSQACENNKGPILNELKRLLASSREVLEIGSGTGQHCVFFAPQLPHLKWHSSDLADNHSSILAWQAELPADNLHAPLEFMIGRDPWPDIAIDAVFTANTTHIMQLDEARLMMQMVARHLPAAGYFCQYGPFNINGQYTSESNERFDQHLQSQGFGGIRDIAVLEDWADGLYLLEQNKLPANNMLLVWQKR